MNLFVFIVAIAICMIFVERLFPNAALPNTPNWWVRAFLFNSAQAIISFVAVLTWDRWFPYFTLMELSSFPMYIQILIGYLSITFLYYWWHRARHEVPILWNLFHQIHHSPARLEIVTSFYKHPLEITVNGLLSSWILHSLLGISPASAATVVMITGIAELFYHWNIRTPYWLGYFFQRPESHRVHHQSGLHRNNYSDLPIWDILFGTFHNPKKSPQHTGFDNKQEIQLKEMLFGKNVVDGRQA